MSKSNNKQFYIQLLIIILINVLASMAFFRIDLTKEKRHSLSETTKEIVKSIDDVVYVKVYLEGDFPAGFIQLRNACKSMLDELRQQSDFIEYEFRDPNKNSNNKDRQKLFDELSGLGLNPINLQIQENDRNSEKIIFPGAIIYYKNKSISLNLLQQQVGTHPDVVLNNSIENIEYELCNGIQKVLSTNKQRIAFLTGNGELSESETADIFNSIGRKRNSLSEYFNVERCDIKEFELDENGDPSIGKQIKRLTGYQAIIIAKPTIPFTDLDKFLIDQYIMNGGKVMWLIDGVAMDMDSLQGNKSYSTALPLDLNISDMLFKYGVRINGNLIMDFQSDQIPVIVGYQGDVPQQRLFPWPYHPLTIPKNDHPISKNLDGIRLSFTSEIDTVKSVGIKKTSILRSSKYSKLVKSPHRVSINLLENEPNIESFTSSEQDIAMLLEGKFKSVFQNRLTPKIDGVTFKDNSKETKMIIVADGDIIKNHVSSSGNPFPLGYNHFSKAQYNGNKDFILNAINYLLGKENVIEIKSKDFSIRMLDKSRTTTEKVKWQIINVAGPILLILLLIGIFNFRRKNKYK